MSIWIQQYLKLQGRDFLTKVKFAYAAVEF